MAAELGMKQQQYARYEKGVTIPGIDVLEKICDIHACSSDWLLGLDRPKSGTTVIGSNNAIGTGARVSVTTGMGTDPSCRKCPYKRAAKALQKAGLKIPGLDG